MKKTSCQTLSKALDISSATAHVAPDLLKALANLSDTTVRKLTGYFLAVDFSPTGTTNETFQQSGKQD